MAKLNRVAIKGFFETLALGSIVISVPGAVCMLYCLEEMAFIIIGNGDNITSSNKFIFDIKGFVYHGKVITLMDISTEINVS